MKDFRGSNSQPNGSDDKDNRIKENLKNDEFENYIPFVKVHHFDCPLVKKPCPLHGEKVATTDLNRCIFISFHPSLRNDNLLLPVQNFVTQSCDDTVTKNQFLIKKNSKYIFRNRLVQTKSEDLKNFSNNYIIEKSKSFADKTSKIKKLKQYFHSPCESIAQKSQSQTSIKEKISGIFRDNLKLIKDSSASENKETIQKSFDDMCLVVGGFENDYNSDEESPLHINKYSNNSKIKIGINKTINNHMEGYQAENKNLNSDGKKSPFFTPYMCYTFGQESETKFKMSDHEFKKQYDIKKNVNNIEIDRPESERNTVYSEASSISSKSSNLEISGSVLYTPIIMVPERMDKDITEGNIYIPTSDLVDKDYQTTTTEKYLFRQISASTQTKFEECICEKIKYGHLLSSSQKDTKYAATQSSKQLIDDEMFDDEGTPRALSTYAHPQKLRSDDNDSNKSESSRGSKKAGTKPILLADTLRSEPAHEELEMFDDEGTPRRKLESYVTTHMKENIDSKEKLKKNVEEQSEDSTESSSSSSKVSEDKEKKIQYNKSYMKLDQKEPRHYKTDVIHEEETAPIMSSYKNAPGQKSERRNTILENKNQKKFNNKETQSEDTSSSSTTTSSSSLSKSIKSPLRSPVAKTSPVRARSKLLDDELFNVPQRPKSSIDWDEKFQKKNIKDAKGPMQKVSSENILSPPKISSPGKNQDLYEKNLETAPVKLAKETVEPRYGSLTDYKGFDENQTVFSSHDISQRRKSKNNSKTNQLHKQKLINLNDVDENIEKNGNEKMLRLRSLEEEITNWPKNMEHMKDPIFQEIRKSQDFVLKNAENLPSSPKTLEALSYYKSKPEERADDIRSISPVVSYRSNKQKYETIQSGVTKDKTYKNEIYMEEKLRAVEKEILQWPDSMNFCKRILLERIEKCRNLNEMLLTKSKEAGPSDVKNKYDQCAEVYDDDQSSQILNSYNFAQVHKEKSNESKHLEDTSQKIIDQMDRQHLMSLSEEIKQWPICKESCREKLLAWVRRNQALQKKCVETTVLKLREAEFLQSEPCEKYEEEKTLPHKKRNNSLLSVENGSQKKISKRKTKHLRSSREESFQCQKDKETPPNELLDGAQISPSCLKKNEDVIPLKSTDTQILQHADLIMETKERIVDKECQSTKKDREKQKSKSKDKSHKKIRNENDAYFKSLEEIILRWANPSESCRNMMLNELRKCKHFRSKNIEMSPGSTEGEETNFEIKKPCSYKSTAICHTSIKFSTNANNLTHTGESEFTAVNIEKVKSSHSTYALNSFSSNDSNESVKNVVNKRNYKSLSCGDLFEKKTELANEVQLTQTYRCSPNQVQSNSSNDSNKPIYPIFDKKEYEEVCSDKKLYEEVCSDKKRYEEVCSDKKQYEEVFSDQKQYEEVFSDQKQYEEVCSDKKQYEEVSSDKNQYEEVCSDKKHLITESEPVSDVCESTEPKKPQKLKEDFCDREHIESVIAAFTDICQKINECLDQLSSGTMKICKCENFFKLESKVHEDKEVMTDLILKNITLNEESPKKLVKREILNISEKAEPLKPMECDEIFLVCDKCAKEIILFKSDGTNTGIPLPKIKSVEKVIVCENNINELRNESKLKEKPPIKLQPKNNQQNVPLKMVEHGVNKDVNPNNQQNVPLKMVEQGINKDVKLPSPENRLQLSANTDPSPRSPRQNDLENKVKTTILMPELKSNENKTPNEQVISKKIEINSETLKKSNNATNCTTKKLTSSNKPNLQEMPKIFHTPVFDNSPVVTKKSVLEPKTAINKRIVTNNCTKSVLESKLLPTKSVHQCCTSNLMDNFRTQPSTSHQAPRNFPNYNQNRECACGVVQKKSDVKSSTCDCTSGKKKNLKKDNLNNNLFMYFSQVSFFRIFRELCMQPYFEIIEQLAEHCETDFDNKSLKDFDRNKQKRKYESEKNSENDVPTDKKFKVFEFGKENNKYDNECCRFLTKQKNEESSVLDLEKLKKTTNLFLNPSSSSPDLRVITNDVIFNKFHKSEVTLKKSKNKQKIYPKSVIHLPDKFLDNENCQSKSTGYLTSMKNQKQKPKCNMCKSFTYFNDADRRPMLEFQEYLLNKLFVLNFLLKLDSLNVEECATKDEPNISKTSSEEN